MCGIAGFVGFQTPLDEARSQVRAMCDAIRHRGPDEDGYHVAEGVALGMRRLSIIDVGGGTQPIYNEDGTVAVVFNGEIYNHHALRDRLEAAGHRFRTRSDTEVLVHLYEDYGAGMANHLHGMFAFAIWDSRQASLLLVRDRTGMKPLSYLETAQGLAFCSELRSLYAVMPERLSLSPQALMKFLAFGYVPEPDGIFAEVNKLPPGHCLEWRQGEGSRVRQYWSPPLPASGPFDWQEAAEGLRDRLDAAVQSHLESEVPIGAFLSGGLDSSTVVALMCRHAHGRVRTFSIGFAEDQFDESADARAVAAELGTEHTELVLRPDAEQMFEAVALMFDEPFADSSAIPTYAVAQLARQSVTVALSGDGGDELFGGYSRYRKTLGYRAYDWGAAGRLLSAAALLLPHAFPGRNRLADLGRSRWGRYAATLTLPVRVDEGGVARSDVPGGLDSIEGRLDRFAHWPKRDFAAAMMLADLQSYLPGDILTKVDRTSMAVSLEARVPLLDAGLVDFALQIPGCERVTAEGGKRLFRQAIRGIVPDSVLARPKRGFEIPLGVWFQGPLRHRIEALRQPSEALRQYVDSLAVNRLVAEHLAGRRDHGPMLWRLMVLERWLAGMREGALPRPPSLPGLPVNPA